MNGVLSLTDLYGPQQQVTANPEEQTTSAPNLGIGPAMIAVLFVGVLVAIRVLYEVGGK